MNVLRHWIVRDSEGKNPRVVTNLDDVAAYCAGGNWQVEGPFVPEPPEGAVEALRLAQTALHNLCLARGSTDGYGHVFEAINAALPTSGGSSR